ncbi:MAG: hypothetical protein RL538_112 [Candidatus Parcubacteria bacterium]|jgi:2-polyprenyl-3-methyl-5-hydroxy-6-metoxy-1,4-benzoquinol methylase
MLRSAHTKKIKETEKFYDKYFSIWTTQKTNAFYHEDTFAKAVKLWPEKGRILDIGCASGIHVPLFLGMGRNLKYEGVDISKSFLKIAKRRYPQLSFSKGNIADGDSLPKKKYDGFWCQSTLHHIPFELWDETFTNLESLCKPQSIGVISLPFGHPGVYEDDTRHVTILSEEEQRAILKKRNWKIVKSGVMDGYHSKAIWRWYIVQLP